MTEPQGIYSEKAGPAFTGQPAGKPCAYEYRRLYNTLRAERRWMVRDGWTLVNERPTPTGVTTLWKRPKNRS